MLKFCGREDIPWARNMNACIREIQRRVKDDMTPRFHAPNIYYDLKNPGGNACRAISEFHLQEKIIDSITARYLRKCLDPVFDAACLAFRCAKNGKTAPQHHDAIPMILNYRSKHKNKPLFVAECDIKGFFDCIDHQQARHAVHMVVAEAKRKRKGLEIDPAALAVLDDYLDCYTFPRNVKRWEEPRLKEKKPDWHFKWPLEDLCTLHKDPMAGAIGIPQGGALSAVVANCLMHKADKALRSLARRSQPTFCYLRYCDDMIIIAPDQDTCKQAFDLYCVEMRKVLLPIHKGKPVKRYDRTFWEAKTRLTYEWGAKRENAVTVPWIQFVGYQIRYDGLLRVRNASMKKHHQKLTQELSCLLRRINGNGTVSGALPQPLRKSKMQILHRFRMRLISLSVGRRAMGQEIKEPMPMCWCSGFKQLDNQPFVISQLKNLDRHRERLLLRLSSILNDPHFSYETGGETNEKKVLPYYGNLFSYAGQFRQGSRRPPSRENRSMETDAGGSGSAGR